MIRLRSGVYEQLAAANGATESKSLDRYFWLLETAMPKLSEAEFNLLCDACNGWASSYEPPEVVAQGLVMQIEDAINYEQLAQKWAVDGTALIAQLQTLSALETLALVEAIEKYWSKE